ncbi:hypothetical protein D9M71_680150 [compost metagenome]
MHVVAGGFHQQFAHFRPAQFEQGLAATDVDDGDVLAGQGFAQFVLHRHFLAAGDDQQPLVGAQPLQRHASVGDHGEGHRQFQAQGLEHAAGKGRVTAVAAQGQVAEQFFLAQGHPGVLAALADQAGKVGVGQRRFGLGAGGGALWVDVDCGHWAPAMNSVSLDPPL